MENTAEVEKQKIFDLQKKLELLDIHADVINLLKGSLLLIAFALSLYCSVFLLKRSGNDDGLLLLYGIITFIVSIASFVIGTLLVLYNSFEIKSKYKSRKETKRELSFALGEYSKRLSMKATENKNSKENVSEVDTLKRELRCLVLEHHITSFKTGIFFAIVSGGLSIIGFILLFIGLGIEKKTCPIDVILSEDYILCNEILGSYRRTSVALYLINGFLQIFSLVFVVIAVCSIVKTCRTRVAMTQKINALKSKIEKIEQKQETKGENHTDVALEVLRGLVQKGVISKEEYDEFEKNHNGR